jgi:hypothetical protein
MTAATSDAERAASPTKLMSPRTARILTAVLLPGAIALTFALWMRGRAEEQAALRTLPDTERRALFERTLATLRTTCPEASRPSGLDDFCTEQARLIVQFEECDQGCRALADAASRKPSR